MMQVRVVAPMVAMAALALGGCRGYDLRIATIEQPDVAAGARVVVFPLSPEPGVVSFPGRMMENLYGRLEPEEWRRIPPKEQAEADVDGLVRGCAGMLVSRRLAERLRSEARGGTTIVDPLAQGETWAQYQRCVVGGPGGWLLPPSAAEPAQDALGVEGLDARELARKYAADFLVWGDVREVRPGSLGCRVVLYDKEGRALWLACATSWCAAMQKNPTSREAVMLAFFDPRPPETRNSELPWFMGGPLERKNPDWLNEIAGRLAAALKSGAE